MFRGGSWQRSCGGLARRRQSVQHRAVSVVLFRFGGAAGARNDAPAVRLPPLHLLAVGGRSRQPTRAKSARSRHRPPLTQNKSLWRCFFFKQKRKSKALFKPSFFFHSQRHPRPSPVPHTSRQCLAHTKGHRISLPQFVGKSGAGVTLVRWFAWYYW